jgi:hypothetical protein
MKFKLIVFLFILVGLLYSSGTFAQKQDSVAVPITPITPPPHQGANSHKGALGTDEPIKDARRLALERMPSRATIRSMIIPGWGQLTNNRWWKVPLIYGGLAIFITQYNANQDSYRSFLTEAQYRVNNNGVHQNPAYDLYTDDGIIQNKDIYRRNRDLCALSIIAIYAANVIDAYVDAKFFRFDISDKLSLRVNPSLQISPATTYAMLNPAIKISLVL